MEQVLVVVAQRLQQNDWIWAGAGVNKRVKAGKSPFAVSRAAQDIVRCITSVPYIKEMYPHMSGRMDRIFDSGMLYFEREVTNAFEDFSALCFKNPPEIVYFLCAMMQKCMQWIGGIQEQLNLLTPEAMETFGGFGQWVTILSGIVEKHSFNPITTLLSLHQIHQSLLDQCNGSINQILQQVTESEDPAATSQLEAGITNLLHRKEYFLHEISVFQEMVPMIEQMHRTTGQGQNVARIARAISHGYGTIGMVVKKAALVTAAQICTELLALDSAKVEPVEMRQLTGFRKGSLKANWSGHGVKLAPAPPRGGGVQMLTIPESPSPWSDKSIYQRGVRM
jgi:hypothetical protein